MIEKVLTIASLDEDISVQDLVYWWVDLLKMRMAAVQLLRERVFDLPAYPKGFSRWQQMVPYATALGHRQFLRD